MRRAARAVQSGALSVANARVLLAGGGAAAGGDDADGVLRAAVVAAGAPSVLRAVATALSLCAKDPGALPPLERVLLVAADVSERERERARAMAETLTATLEASVGGGGAAGAPPARGGVAAAAPAEKRTVAGGARWTDGGGGYNGGDNVWRQSAERAAIPLWLQVAAAQVHGEPSAAALVFLTILLGTAFYIALGL
jgi:hypothetical protein